MTLAWISARCRRTYSASVTASHCVWLIWLRGASRIVFIGPTACMNPASHDVSDVLGVFLTGKSPTLCLILLGLCGGGIWSTHRLQIRSCAASNQCNYANEQACITSLKLPIHHSTELDLLGHETVLI
jgi:hypothetical protein